jgi:hypothetical protein
MSREIARLIEERKLRMMPWLKAIILLNLPQL